MKIYIANESSQQQGGGFSFIRNLKKGMGSKIVDTYESCDIVFIPSASMVKPEIAEKAKSEGKKVILRCDNVLRNSRNRNKGMSRMKTIATISDLIIYQSEWARNYLMPFLKKDGRIIINGVDLSLYPILPKSGNTILYSRFNRDETKNWEAARYWYSRYQLYHPEAKLLIVGQFSDELRAGNFDFYNGENYEYLGVLDERNMAKIYGVADKFLYTYFNDACSNSLIEALASGCEIVGDDYYRKTGGAPEIIYKHFIERGRDYFSIERMGKEYKQAFESLKTRGYEGSL